MLRDGRVSAAVGLAVAALLTGACGGAEKGTTSTGATTPSVAPDVGETIMRPLPGETLAAAVIRRVALRSSPAGPVLFHVSKRTSFRSPAVLTVMRQRGDWLGVATGDLANGKLGWVRQREVRMLRETWKIVVDLSERRGTLLHMGKRYRSFSLAVGSPIYATPTGRFGVTDRLHLGPGGPYGCCALALSAHQPHVPQDWPGGDRIAIHATNDPASVGQAVSHGCLRASDETIRLLMAKVPLGSQVLIHA